MRNLIQTKKFKKDIIRLQRRDKSMIKLRDLLMRIRTKIFNSSDKDHALKGNFAGYRECHVTANWIVVYRELDESTVELYRTGTHQDIFKQNY